MLWWELLQLAPVSFGHVPSIFEYFLTFWCKMFQAHPILFPFPAHFSNQPCFYYWRFGYLETKIRTPAVLIPLECYSFQFLSMDHLLKVSSLTSHLEKSILHFCIGPKKTKTQKCKGAQFYPFFLPFRSLCYADQSKGWRGRRK